MKYEVFDNIYHKSFDNLKKITLIVIWHRVNQLNDKQRKKILI